MPRWISRAATRGWREKRARWARAAARGIAVGDDQQIAGGSLVLPDPLANPAPPCAGMNSRGRAPPRTWPVGMKWLAGLDIASARRQVARRTRDAAHGGVSLPPAPRPGPHASPPVSAHTRRKSRPGRPCGPATCTNATQASMPRVQPLPRRPPAGTNQAVLPRPAPPPGARPGRVSRPRLAARRKQIRNTMSGRSSSVVYGVTVGKRERNPLMGNMKRSRRTLKWPAGFS